MSEQLPPPVPVRQPTPEGLERLNNPKTLKVLFDDATNLADMELFSVQPLSDFSSSILDPQTGELLEEAEVLTTIERTRTVFIYSPLIRNGDRVALAVSYMDQDGKDGSYGTTVYEFRGGKFEKIAIGRPTAARKSLTTRYRI